MIDPRRVLALIFAMSVLTGACALVIPPPPDTVAVQAKVINQSDQDVRLVILTPRGEVPMSVQPSTATARTTTDVTLYLPVAGDWAISVGPPVDISLPRKAIGVLVERHCVIFVEIDTGQGGADCDRDRPSIPPSAAR